MQDLVSVGVLAADVPRDVIDEVLSSRKASCGPLRSGAAEHADVAGPYCNRFQQHNFGLTVECKPGLVGVGAVGEYVDRRAIRRRGSWDGHGPALNCGQGIIPATVRKREELRARVSVRCVLSAVLQRELGGTSGYVCGAQVNVLPRLKVEPIGITLGGFQIPMLVRVQSTRPLKYDLPGKDVVAGDRHAEMGVIVRNRDRTRGRRSGDGARAKPDGCQEAHRKSAPLAASLSRGECCRHDGPFKHGSCSSVVCAGRRLTGPVAGRGTATVIMNVCDDVSRPGGRGGHDSPGCLGQVVPGSDGRDRGLLRPA